MREYVSELNQETPAAVPPVSAFVVERRVPAMSSGDVAMLIAGLEEACKRLRGRGRPVRRLMSVHLQSQERVLCLFEASTRDDVRAANEIAQAPFASIDPAVRL